MPVKFTRRAWNVGLLTTIFTLLGVMVAAAASGALDTTFSGDGVQTTDFFSGRNEETRGIALQPDGKIVAVGDRWDQSKPPNDPSHNFAVARYNPNGSLDSTFSSDGKQVTDFGGVDTAYNVAIQPVDGKIVVAGATSQGVRTYLAVARYKPDGRLDSTFSGDGKVVIGFGSSANGGGGGLAIRGDGKIVIGGYMVNSAGDQDFAVYRLNPNGTLDTSFSVDGKANINFGPGSYGWGRDLILQSGKVLIVGGNADDGSPYSAHVALARLNPNGSLDTTFSGDGRQEVYVGGQTALGTAVAAASNGRIVVVADTCLDDPCAWERAGVVRFNANGSLDTTFNGTGAKSLLYGFWVTLSKDVLVQPDGKIVVAGQAYGLGTVLWRIWPGGSLDSSFSGDGRALITSGPTTYALARQIDGKYVLGGSMYASSQYDFALARVWP